MQDLSLSLDITTNLDYLAFQDNKGYSSEKFSGLIRSLCFNNTSVRFLALRGDLAQEDPILPILRKKFPPVK